jgi:hypothetical protein
MNVTHGFCANQVEDRPCAFKGRVVVPRDDVVGQQTEQHIVESRIELEETACNAYAPV